MFAEKNERDRTGEPLQVCVWAFPEADGGGARTWQAVRREQWLFRDSSTYAGIEGRTVPSEPHTSELHLCVAGSGDFTVTHDAAAWRVRVTADAGGRAALVIGLGSTLAEAEEAASSRLRRPAAAAQRQGARYRAVAESTPTLDFGRHTALQRFFRLTPMYLESMRIAGQPGAFRANNDYYWVWGWDMTRPAFGLLCGGRHDFVRQLLELRANTKYVNQYDNTLAKDLRWSDGLPGALEYMLAHDYLAWTGDREGTRILVPSFTRALALACDNPDPSGMTPGAAASTDFPEEFGRTFRARLAYTTAWDYGGYLAAEKLLLAWGDERLAERVRELAARIRRSFGPVFWNAKTGFWNEGVHASDPDLVCDIPLSTSLAAMDSPYGEDLCAEKLAASARFAKEHFLREDGVHITARGEVRGWKEWTRQPNNWFAANDTMLARLFRAVGDIESLEKLFYLYEINFGYQPAAFEGKPFRRPLHTSGSWQAFGAGSWYRNLVEAAAGLWADLGGLTLVPGGLGEPVRLGGLRFRDAVLEFEARGQGVWPTRLALDGTEIRGTTKLPPLSAAPHRVSVEYGPAVPSTPVLTLAVDAAVAVEAVSAGTLRVRLQGRGYTPVAFYAPGAPSLTVDGRPVPCEWDADTRRGRSRFVLERGATLEIHCGA
jgi:hypothetical protein